jgi:uncharacterized protein YfaS (alpha-2-macroglobulin family)
MPPPVDLPPPALPGPLVYWDTAVRTGPSGVLSVTLQLPDEPADLQALAWAASGAERFGQADAGLAITRPLELELAAPDFFRTGDRVELAAFVRNTSSVTQAATLVLSAAGVEVPDTALSQRLQIAAGARMRIAWPAQVGTAPRAMLSFELRPDGGTTISRRVERPILSSSQESPANGEVGLLREYLDPLTNRPLGPGQPRIGQLVRVRLTVVNYSARRAIVLEEPLPGGMALVEAENAGFAEIGRNTTLLSLAAGELAPGIYRYSYLLRAVAAGQYDVPPTTLQSGGELLGAGGPAQIVIGAQP